MVATEQQQLRQDLIVAYRQADEMGLMGQSSGNISCRVDDGMLISGSGVSASNLTTERVVKVFNDGRYDGDLKPSSEWRMHLGIYQRQQKATAIVHTHSDYCVAMAVNNLSLPGFHYMVGMFGGTQVPCVPYSTFGTEQLAIDAANALEEFAACLLGNHGMICRGDSFNTALAHAERLETLCKHYVLARQLGEPSVLSDQQWQEFFRQMKDLAYSTLE